VRAGSLAALLSALLLGLLVATPTPAVWSQALGAQQPTASSTPGLEGDAPNPAAGPTTTSAPGAAPPASTPQPTGQPLPSKRQRVADTLVAAFLLVVLVAGVAVAWFRARPSRPQST
jgi:hypothetical protein